MNTRFDRLEKSLEGLALAVHRGFLDVYARLDGIDVRLDDHNAHIQSIDATLKDMNAHLEVLDENKHSVNGVLDGFAVRITCLEEACGIPSPKAEA